MWKSCPMVHKHLGFPRIRARSLACHPEQRDRRCLSYTWPVVFTHTYNFRTHSLPVNAHRTGETWCLAPQSWYNNIFRYGIIARLYNPINLWWRRQSLKGSRKRHDFPHCTLYTCVRIKMSYCVSRLRVFSFWRLIMCPICCATIFSLVPNQPQTLSFGQVKKKKKSKNKKTTITNKKTRTTRPGWFITTTASK